MIPEETRALVRAARAFAVEQPARTWAEVAPTLLLAAATQALLLAPVPLGWKLPLGLLHALVLVRVFAFFHDVQHCAIFRRSSVGRWLVNAFSLYFVYSPPVWRSRHDAHHRRNSLTNAREVAGQIPMVTLSAWQRLDPSARRLYRLFRHPLAVAGGLFTYFALPSWRAFRAQPRRCWTAPVWMAVPPVALLVVAAWRDVATALVAIGLPLLVSSMVGSYLFYAQHSFEGVRYQEREDWDYFYAALHTSSMFDMPALLHWFTGNIGYHHVHHVNAAIPFYRLPEAMAAIPALQRPALTSWRLADVRHVLTRHVWDDTAQRLLTYEEADRAAPGV
jgi:omega-6 fatty acid desaturase (delta-12 desaturase)